MPMRPFFLISILLLARFEGIAQNGNVTTQYRDSAFIGAILTQHNAYRSALHLPALTWSPALAADALKWAQKIARSGDGQHDRSIVGREGENIWWGTHDVFSYAEMIGFWGSEKKDFVYGIFPDCKSSRSAMVGHYTQIIWKNTTSVGCAVTTNGGKDFLVCRYAPAGNMIGEKPY